MRSWLLAVFGVVMAAVIVTALIYTQKLPPHLSGLEGTLATSSPSSTNSSLTSPEPSMSMTSNTNPQPATSGSLTSTAATPLTNNPHPDLSVDANGLSKATVFLTTTEGMIQFKFYTDDAPNTVKRFVELIHQGFYNGLTFHRVVPDFVIQGGDPLGNGTGGSGKNLKAEFNKRHHVEGAVAMARGMDPNSADSQFYITLGTYPHLDYKYTIFGQVVEGMDVAKRIKVGDKMTSVIIQ